MPKQPGIRDPGPSDVRLAIGLPFDIQPDLAEVAAFNAKLPAARRLKRENVEKEMLWRMAVNSAPGANGPGCSMVSTPP